MRKPGPAISGTKKNALHNSRLCKKQVCFFWLFIFFIHFVYLADAQAAWQCDCSHRKPITINNTGSSLTDYQLRINVSHESSMNADFSDLLFTTDDGETEIPRWVETFQTSTTATVWVKLPSLPVGKTTIYMYYGGCSPSLTTPEDVFIFYDDFSNFTGWTDYGSGTVIQNTSSFSYAVGQKSNNNDPNGAWKSIGTTIDNFRLITREQRPAGTTGGGLNRYGVENSNFDGYTIRRSGKNGGGSVDFGFERRDNGGGGNYININAVQPEDTWLLTELRRCSSSDETQAILFADNRSLIGNTPAASISGHNYANFDRVAIHGGYIYYIDFMAVAKYSCNEPTVSVGVEQEPAAADFTWSNSGLVVDFTDQSTGSQLSYSWNFTDGSGIPSTSTDQNPTVNYPQDGDFAVSLTVTDDCGNQSTTNQTITVEGYCNSSGDCIAYPRYINRVRFGNIDNSSMCDVYGEFTANSTNLIIGESETLVVDFTNLNDSYNIGAWIDWNRDGDFDDTNELVINCVNAGTGNSQYSNTITTPTTAELGTTRLRIRLLFNGDLCDACGDYISGETEDYTVNVLPECTSPSITTHPSTNGESLCLNDNATSLSVTATGDGLTYQWYSNISQSNSGGTIINGATNSTYTPGTSTAGILYYYCVITGDCGTITSSMSGAILVEETPASGNLSKSPNEASICAGTNVSASLSSGSGGNGTDKLEYSTDGGVNWSSYTSGAPISTTGLTDVQIRTRRLADYCNHSVYNTVSWAITPLVTPSVSISADPGWDICAGTEVTFTANPTNGGSNPVFQWKLNGIDIGTNSNTFNYTLDDGDIISCILTSDAVCTAGGASIPISEFSWNDNNTRAVTDSDYGLDATAIGGGVYLTGGVGGTLALGPVTDPKTNINLNFGDQPEFNTDGVDYSISYRRAENVGQLFYRGNSLVISGGNTFNVSYRLNDGAGSFTTVNSSDFQINQDGSFHDYRFVYNPSDGIGRLYIDNSEVWTSSPTPGQSMYWTGAGDLMVGREIDASGNAIPTFDNLSVKGIRLNTAFDEKTVTVHPLPATGEIIPD